MNRIADQIKQALSALAQADAGEISGRYRMEQALNPQPIQSPVPDAPRHRFIALGLGDSLPPQVMEYVLGACRRMNADLLLVARDAQAAAYLIDPWLPQLGGIHCEVEELPDASRGAVIRVLARRSGVLFAVSGGPDSPVARLVNGRRGLLAGKSPVPVVLVTDHPQSAPSLSPAGDAPFAAAC
jgi:hypothetical protein